MSDRDADAELAHQATVTTLRAVMTALSTRDRELFVAIQTVLQSGISTAVPSGDQAQRDAVHAKAQQMFFSHL